MVLRKEQLAHFSQITTKRFVKKSVEFLSNGFPQWCKGKEEKDVVAYIHEAIAFGARFGIKREINVQKLMALDIGHGLFALDQAEISAVLKDEELHQDRKMEELFIELNARNYRKKQLVLS